MINHKELPTPKTLHPGTTQAPKRSFLSTLSIMLVGWLIGNLILLMIVVAGVLLVVSASGLVKIPYLTSFFFDEPKIPRVTAGVGSQPTAEAKIASLSALAEGESWPLMEFTEPELNYFLNKLVGSSSKSVITNSRLKISEEKITLQGQMAETGAPFSFKGVLDVNSYRVSINLTDASVGKFNLPPLIATRVLDSILDSIGFDPKKSILPIGDLQIKEGKILLRNVKPVK